MSVADVIERRNITEALHFTTNLGLVGMLASGGILSRARLPEEKYLERVYKPNANVRKDREWLDYVNLSITHINTEFFDHSERWHEHDEVWWCIVSLDPIILTHEGVLFATTNNMYSGCRQAAGEAGLEGLFAERIRRWNGNDHDRVQGLDDCATTCHQAEALYPERVAVEYFRRVYVATPEHADIVGSQSELFPPELPVDVRPEVFEPR